MILNGDPNNMKYICIYGASSDNIDGCYFDEIEKLGRLMAENGLGLVFGGGAHGLMGAAARGVKAGGGKAVGIAPAFFDTGDILFKNCDEFYYPENMRERKRMFEERSSAFITVPGGIGTFDEFFEIVTLKHLGLHDKPIVLLNVNGYFDPLIAMVDHASKCGFMKADPDTMFKVCGSPEEAVEYLTRCLYN